MKDQVSKDVLFESTSEVNKLVKSLVHKIHLS